MDIDTSASPDLLTVKKKVMKIEQPKSIMAIDWEQAKELAFIATGMPENFQLKKLDKRNDGGSPHVRLYYRHFEPVIGHGVSGYVGIFDNLNTYLHDDFISAYCQKELFECFKKHGFYTVSPDV